MKKIGRNRCVGKAVEPQLSILGGPPYQFSYTGFPRTLSFNEEFGGSCNVVPFRGIRGKVFLAALPLTLLFLLGMLT